MGRWQASGMRFLITRTLPGAVLIALLQACGGGGGDSTNNETASVEPPASASPDPSATPSAPATPQSATPDISCGLAAFEAEALRIVNERRAAGASCGARGSFAPAAALTLNSKLTSAAFGHARDMADNDYFSHDSQDGRSMVDRVNATGYTWSTIGENIAAGYYSVQSVVDGWMSSDGHCANLMNPRFTEFGLACARNSASTYRIYWAQNLGRP
jgi:uncharacterized protein YkwD